MCILSSPSDLWVPKTKIEPQNAMREEDLVAGEWLSVWYQQAYHPPPGILQVATVLAFLPSWERSFWNQAECFPLSWYTLEAGMQACSLCSCHREKHGNLTLRRFHGILGLNKQQVANHVLVRTLASWGRGCTRLHSYPLCRSWAPLLVVLTGKAHPRCRFG